MTPRPICRRTRTRLQHGERIRNSSQSCFRNSSAHRLANIQQSNAQFQINRSPPASDRLIQFAVKHAQITCTDYSHTSSSLNVLTAPQSTWYDYFNVLTATDTRCALENSCCCIKPDYDDSTSGIRKTPLYCFAVLWTTL